MAFFIAVKETDRKRKTLLYLSHALIPLFAIPITPAHATDYYWDTDGAVAGSGGAAPNGAWSAGGSTLSTDNTGASATGAVTTTTGDSVTFSAGADASGNYAITINGTQSIGGLTFEDGTPTLTGGTINFGGVSGLFDVTGTPTINSVLTGTAGITKNGGGILTLNGANSYTGATTINTGTLSIGNGGTTGSIAASSDINLAGGATLIWNNNNITTAHKVLTNTLTGTGTVVFQGQNDSTALQRSIYNNNGDWSGFSGNIVVNDALFWVNSAQSDVGTGTIFVEDNGTMGFNGSTFSNDIVLEGGEGWHHNVSGFDVVIGAMRLEGNNTLTGDIMLNGAANPITLGDNNGTGSTIGGWQTGNHTLSGVISGVGGFAMNRYTSWNNGSPQNVNIDLAGTASNTYTGTTVVDGQGARASLRLMKTGGAVAIAADTTVQMGSGTNGQANLRIGDTVTTGAARNQWDNQFGAGVVMDFVNVNGQWMRFDLQGTNQTLAGLNAGTLATRAGAVIQNQNWFGFNPGQDAMLTLNGAGDYLYNGYIRDQDNGGTARKLNLVWDGAGSQTLAGNAIYHTGSTIVADGQLILHNATAFRSATTVENGATLSWDGTTNLNIASTHSITLNDGATLENLNPTSWTVLGGAITSSGNTTINHNSDAVGSADRGFYLDGGLHGTGTITINAANAGSGVNFRNNNSTFSGDLIVNGIASATSFSGSGLGVGGCTVCLTDADITLNGTMEMRRRGIGWANNNAATFNMGALSGSGIMIGHGGTATFGHTDNNGLFSGTIVNGVGATSIVKTGTGTQTFTGDNTYTGGTTISGGILELGNGGASGSILGNVVNNATLDFNRSDTYTFGGVISGTGAVNQNGAGSTILTANNTYTGPTTVNAGELRINRSTAASSTVTANAGSTLGGNGAINGSVIVANGATLDPGATAGTVGLLTTGDLTLAATSEMTYDLGEADVVGGPNNDRVQVNGDLTLGGSVNVNAAGGSFADTLLPGSYRLIDYTGTLLGGGLAIGTIPADYASSEIQTVIDGEVNLIAIQNGVPLQYWDGTDTTGNGTFDGGTEDWNNTTGNWTNTAGNINQAWVPGVGIFTGTAGVATMAEPISAMGLQFVTDGYEVTGETLTLVQRPDGSIPFIRVDAGATAEISAEIDGVDGLFKTDAGTLILTGGNSYSGGTTVGAGTLQVGVGGTRGTLGAGNVINEGNLIFNRSDLLTIAGSISGGGSIRQIGAGRTNLTGIGAAFTGTTTIESGVLAVNGSLCGDVNVQTGTRLEGNGTVCDTTNSGTVAPGNSIGTILVDGDYMGNGGTLEIEAEFGDDGFAADRLLISGDVTGVTNVNTVNLGDTGAPTGFGPTDGASVIQASDTGTTTSAGSFVLPGGYVAAGPYQYVLNAFDPASSNNGELDPRLAAEGVTDFWDFRLQSEGQPVPQIAAYQAIPSGAFQYSAALLNGMQDAAHNQSCADGKSKFLNSYGGHTDFDGDKSAGYSQNTWFMQGGLTLAGRNLDGGDSVICGGAALSFGGADVNLKGSSGEVDLKSVGASLTGTFRASGGWYVNAIASVNHFSTTISTDERGLVGSPDGVGVGISIRTGLPIEMERQGVIVEPVAGLSFQQAWFDKFIDVDDIETSLQGGDSLQGRLGGRIKGTIETSEWGSWEPHTDVYVIHEFFTGESIRAAGVKFPTDLGGTSLHFDAGFSAKFSPLTDLSLNISYEEGIGKGTGDTIGGMARVRWRF